MAQLLTDPRIQALDGVSSKPGAKLEFFTTGTTTQVDTYSDISLSTVNANPVIADGDGRFAAIFANDFSVIKAVLTDADDVEIWTQDPLSGEQVSGQFQEWNTSSIYGIDDTVQGSDGCFYKSIIDPNEGNDPTTTATAWSKTVIITEWNTNETYDLDDTVRGSDGKLYYSVDAINIGNDPTADDGTNWDRTLTENTDFVELKSGRHNKVINGNFNINQEDVVGTVVLSATEYGHDQWRAGSTGCTYTFATSNNVTTLTITAGTLEQVIEGDNIFSGDHVLSWTGTAQGQIDSGGFGDTGATATLVGGTNTTIEFGTGTLALVQLETGTTITDFEERDQTIELNLARRYFQKSYDQGTAPGTVSELGKVSYIAASTGTSQRSVEFQTMRTAPSVTFYSPGTGASGNIRNQTTGSDIAATASSVGDSGFTVNSTHVDGNSYGLHYVLGARF